MGDQTSNNPRSGKINEVLKMKGFSSPQLGTNLECQTQWFMLYHDFVWNAVTVFLAIPRNQLSNLISVFLGGIMQVASNFLTLLVFLYSTDRWTFYAQTPLFCL